MNNKKSKINGHVPKPVKNRLWDSTYGPEAGQGECYVCGVIINSKSFEAGHVKAAAKGGLSIVENLRCICSDCNKSMGTQNLEVFKAIYFPNRVNAKKCTCACKKDKAPKYVKVGHFRKEVKNNINYYEYWPEKPDSSKKEPLYDEEIEARLISKIKELDQFVYKP